MSVLRIFLNLNDLEELLDLLFYILNVVSRLKACHNFTFTIHEEFGEIPLYIARFAPAREILVEDVFENGREFVVLVKTLERLLRFEPGVEGEFVGTIHLCLAKLREVYTELQRAEFADFGIRTRSLSTKLVARHI